MSLNIKPIFYLRVYPAPRQQKGLKCSSGGSTETKLDTNGKPIDPPKKVVRKKSD